MYGIEIKNARKAKGLTQKQVEELTGIPQRTISWIEKGDGIPNVEHCKLLAECYNITIDELIGNEHKKKW